MKKTSFVTRFQRAARPAADDPAYGLGELHARGMDNADFYIAPNIGEEPRPLSRIASGGDFHALCWP